jgi:hypothetical protein
MNEVESGTRRAVEEGRSAVVSVWDWFTDLGQGSWLLGLGVLMVAGLSLALIMGRGGESVCDKAIQPVHDLRLRDGNQSLQPDAAHSLHQDADTLDGLVSEATGDQRAALQALASAARHARRNEPFHAHSALDAYQSACG